MTKLMIRHYLTLNVPYPGAMALKIFGSIPDPSDPTMMKQSRGNVNLVMSTAPVAVSMATMGGRSEVSLNSSSGGAGGEEEGSNDDDDDDDNDDDDDDKKVEVEEEEEEEEPPYVLARFVGGPANKPSRVAFS
jgi:hypothetical protein